jgi:hypothetical protein
MKLLVLDPDFGKSALLMDNKKRAFNHLIVIQKMLDIFEKQKSNTFASVPNYKLWRDYPNAMKVYFNALLQVCKDIHKINTKYKYYEDFPEKINYPKFTDVTFVSHRAFLVSLDPELYIPKFGELDFNSNKLFWEYWFEKDGEKYLVAEDFNGIKRVDILLENNPDFKSDYNLEEINYKYTKLRN